MVAAGGSGEVCRLLAPAASGAVDFADAWSAAAASCRSSSGADLIMFSFLASSCDFCVGAGRDKRTSATNTAAPANTHATRGQKARRRPAGLVSGPGLPKRRATSPCRRRRVAGCNSSGGPASSRRFSAQPRSSFSIGRSGSDAIFSYRLDGKTGDFSPEKSFRTISTKRSRHLLSRELTVLGFISRVWLISS